MFAKVLKCLVAAALVAGLPAVGFAAPAEKGVHAEHDPTHDIGHGNHGPALEDPTEVKSDLALFTFVVFLLLLAILWKFAWGPISAGLDKREESIAHAIAEAHRAHEEAKLMLLEHEQKLAGTAAEVRAIMEEARKDAEAAKQGILAEAKAGATAERDRALRDIESATDAALKALAERSADLAITLAGKIVGSQLKPADHTRLIQEAVARFPAGKPSSN